ncbi:hypothetical protein IG631_06758 [Alternaria alternata]|nr:hypothetical protein IG631_06758 [Alternaria alternata]
MRSPFRSHHQLYPKPRVARRFVYAPIATLVRAPAEGGLYSRHGSWERPPETVRISERLAMEIKSDRAGYLLARQVARSWYIHV